MCTERDYAIQANEYWKAKLAADAAQEPPPQQPEPTEWRIRDEEADAIAGPSEELVEGVNFFPGAGGPYI
jgi:hypothetical protein